MKRSRLTAWLLGGGLVLAAHAASAEDDVKAPGSDDPGQRRIEAQRRSGLTLGASGGAALAGSSGYPNSVKVIGNPDYYSSSPLLAGWSSSWFLMGAFSDYVNFGPMVTIATFESDRWKSTGWGAGFRGEVFPLVKVLPTLADLAIYGQAGFGVTELRAKGPYPSAEAAQSFLGVGIHHEWRVGRLLGGHAAAGPYIEYDSIRSTTAERHWATAGLRVAFYGGSVKLDR